MRFPRIAADDTRESNHGLAKMRIPNCRKATLVEPLSCNFGYLLATFYLAKSAASGFFTDDYLLTAHCDFCRGLVLWSLASAAVAGNVPYALSPADKGHLGRHDGYEQNIC